MAYYDKNKSKTFGQKPRREEKNSEAREGNLGLEYNQGYYRGFSFKNLQSDQTEAYFKRKNKRICEHKMIKFPYEVLGNTQFELTTQYPGLVLGLGYGHGINALGEFKLGFSFDYTSGLPVIPGSTVKGMLRSVFPGENWQKKVQFLEEKTGYIQGILKKKIDISALEKELFEGKDVFFDAVLHEKNDGKTVVAPDSITPHGNNPLKNPVPLLFLKVRPEITFRFDFFLNDGLITRREKENLYRQILLDFGIGAKTNVGYGQFKNPEKA